MPVSLKIIARKEKFLLLLLLILLFLSIIKPENIKNYPRFIHWQTIGILAGLLLISSGLKDSGVLHILAKRLLSHIHTERKLALFLILLTAFFSSFMTNDVALFVVVPLAISMQNLLSGDVSKIIVFAAISANVGSSLTPIGNPQNIFIWQKWGISFSSFILYLFPLTLALLSILLIFAFLSFRNNRLEIMEKGISFDRFLAISSFSLIIIYLLLLQLDLVFYILPVVFLFYLFLFPSVVKRTDWSLLLIFIIIFIDFQCISNLSIIQRIMENTGMDAFLFSTILSQIMSNVPATIFISNFSNEWLKIAYGVNVGGNGFVIASLANIIAIRLSRRELWKEFHKYSLPFFLLSAIIAYSILQFIL